MSPDPRPPESSPRASIALIEDDTVLGAALTQRLRLEGYDVEWCQRLAEGEAALARRRPDLLLCDLRLPDGSGEALFLNSRGLLSGAPVMFLTAYAEIDQAVRLMRAGADDFLVKPFEVPDLLARIAGLLARRVAPVGETVLGRSIAIRRIEATLHRAAAVESNVLLLGESGVGKEVAARLLHAVSPRAHAPFIAVNCAAIPADLLESELFGHERGAFTGATARHEGYAERARDGVLFLDEIADLPVALQPKLLRLVEARGFSRVGGTAALPFRARIVAATNVDLVERALQGRFREDLLYRLDVIRLEIPPLRARPEDVPALAARFLADFAERFGRGFRGFDPDAVEAMLAHPWPGNARELRNRIERAVALGDGAWLTAADLFPDLATLGAVRDGPPTLATTLASTERRAIQAALEATGWDVSAAAERLGVGRSTLFDKVRRLRLVRSGDVADPETRTDRPG